MRTLTLLLLGFLTVARALVAAPLPADQPGYTERDLDNDRVRWVEAHIVEPARAFADPPLTERQLAFLRDSAVFVDRMFAIGDRAPILAEAAALAAEKPTDPWLLRALAGEFLIAKQRDTAAPLAAQALQAIKTSRYPDWFHYMVATTAADAAAMPNAPNQQSLAADRYASERFLAFIQSGYGPFADQRFFYLQHRRPSRSMFPPELMPEFIAKLEAIEGGHQWLKNLILGDWYTFKAWEARGNGFAHQVKDSAWPVFFGRLHKAQAALEAAHALRTDLPDAAYSMLTVVKGLGEQANHDERYWFDECIKAQFDYHAAYHSILDNLMPRWGGSHEQMLDFAQECLDTDRFDTRVPYVLIYTLEGIRHDFNGKLDFLRDEPGLYRTAAALLDRYIEGYQREIKVADNRFRRALVAYRLRSFPTQRAILAWWAHDWQAGRAALQSINFAIESDSARRLGSPGERLIEELLLYGGPAGKDALAARDAIEAADLPEATRRIAAAKATLNSATDLDNTERFFANRGLGRLEQRTAQ